MSVRVTTRTAMMVVARFVRWATMSAGVILDIFARWVVSED